MSKSISVYKIFYLAFPLLGFALLGCSTTSELYRADSKNETFRVDYSIIYYIHADSDYMYSDPNGEMIVDNNLVLEDALDIASNAKSGEVFVFHQRSEKKLLGIIPRKRSRLYYYANGEKISQVRYRHHDRKEEFLSTEIQLFDQYRSQNQNVNLKSYFLFFGHEIPSGNGIQYHRSLPDISVTAQSFSAGIKRFLTSNDQRFELVVLSTCNNASPFMVEQLIPISDLLLASSQNLHLSHINTGKLGLLESGSEISTIQLAHFMADHTFKRLELEVQSTITLSVFDFDIVQKFRKGLYNFSKSYNTMGDIQDFADNIDCSHIASFDLDTFGRGVKTWYKPAKFGKKSNSDIHSGWGCKPIIEQ